jgi:general secretion pathway protein L
MIHEFLQWWGVQLARLWPWHGVATSLPRRMLVLIPGDTGDPALTLKSENRGVTRVLGRFTTDADSQQAFRRALRAVGNVPLVLRLPPGAILDRQVTLPLAAERDAEAALQHDMDRLTPFRAADIVWAADIVGRDRGRGLLQLRLLLVVRTSVAAILAMVAAAGVTVAFIQSRAADGMEQRIALGAGRHPAWRRQAIRISLFACVALMATLIVMPFLRQERMLEVVNARIAHAQPLAREASEIRQRLTEAAASGDVIAATQLEFGSTLGVWAALTEVLPDDTFLVGLTLRRRQVVLRGQSANAARLIALLAASKEIREPSFAAPVTRAAGDGQDQFTIAATVEQ